MVRRSTPQRKIDDAAFPVRLKVAVPRFGFGGMLDRIQAWLYAEIGAADCAWHPAPSYGVRDAVGFHFRSLTEAQRFVEAFPELEIPDGTQSPSYTSPAVEAQRAAAKFQCELRQEWPQQQEQQEHQPEQSP